jgi:hypothetical protein
MRKGTYQAVEMTKVFAAKRKNLPSLNHKNQPGINHPRAMVEMAGAGHIGAFAAGVRFRVRAQGNGGVG